MARARKRLGTRDLVALFQREAGVCHLCRGTITPGQPWDVSHDIPLELGGADDASNWRVAHRVCHRDHTARVDVPAIAQAKRREASHMGAPVVKQPIKSPGFAKRTKSHEGRPSLPPRPISEDAQ